MSESRSALRCCLRRERGRPCARRTSRVGFVAKHGAIDLHSGQRSRAADGCRLQFRIERLAGIHGSKSHGGKQRFLSGRRRKLDGSRRRPNACVDLVARQLPCKRWRQRQWGRRGRKQQRCDGHGFRQHGAERKRWRHERHERRGVHRCKEHGKRYGTRDRETGRSGARQSAGSARPLHGALGREVGRRAGGLRQVEK